VSTFALLIIHLKEMLRWTQLALAHIKCKEVLSISVTKKLDYVQFLTVYKSVSNPIKAFQILDDVILSKC